MLVGRSVGCFCQNDKFGNESSRLAAWWIVYVSIPSASFFRSLDCCDGCPPDLSYHRCRPEIGDRLNGRVRKDSLEQVMDFFLENKLANTRLLCFRGTYTVGEQDIDNECSASITRTQIELLRAAPYARSWQVAKTLRRGSSKTSYWIRHWRIKRSADDILGFRKLIQTPSATTHAQVVALGPQHIRARLRRLHRRRRQLRERAVFAQLEAFCRTTTIS